MRSLRSNVVFVILAALLVAAAASSPSASSRPAAPAKPYTLEQVLCAPFPESLVAAKKADRIAWMANDGGARNVWTASAPDFRPVNLTDFARDEVFEIPEVLITE